MKIHILNRDGWNDILKTPAKRFRQSLQDNIFIIRNYFSAERAQEIRSICQTFAKNTDATWYPCEDNIPDYHRIHNNYEKAYVKSKQHGFYYHPWNKGLLNFSNFREIFEFKLKMGNFNASEFDRLLKNIPSSGTIMRLVVHQYPRGGGGQQRHVDPVSKYARVQTLIMLSERGVDYENGGLYVETKSLGRIELDPLLKLGDLILLSPSIIHGVDQIDHAENLSWLSDDGRWILLPIMLDSDYVKTNNRPMGLQR
jgi:hypothetical protein